jgi:hypothetical protein
MKVIVSHDVDHLYPSDHLFKDLIFPKLWIRTIIGLVRGKIDIRTFYFRMTSFVDKRLNRIPEIIEFDKANSVPSIFFFGMANKLGMSYNKRRVIPWIEYVLRNGFEAGVHGVEFDETKKMKEEFKDFKTISHMESPGVRIHYVRYNSETFAKLASIGYSFDSSEFNKNFVDLKPPYKVNSMWEFPLYIMDGYILLKGIEEAQLMTKNALRKAEESGLEFFTFLFHDYLFNEKSYPDHKRYYEWFIDFCKIHKLEFVTYTQAIAGLEINNNKNGR